MAPSAPVTSSLDAPLTLVVHPDGSVLTGKVVDATGGSIAGALISVRAAGDAAVVGGTMSNREGGFALRLPAGEFDVLAVAEAYAAASVRAQVPSTGLTLVMEPAASIEGRAVSADTDDPIEGAKVVAIPTSRMGLERFEAVSEADGSFRFAALPSAIYAVAVSGSGWQGPPEAVAVDMGSASDFVLLRASSASVFEGLVGIGEAPCPAADIRLEGPAGSFSAFSRDGSVLFDPLPAGAYRAAIHCQGAASMEDIVEVAPGLNTRRWTLDQGLSVEGRVQNQRGEGVPNARVNIAPLGESGGGRALGCESDAAGDFTCTGLRVGAYECSVLGNDGPVSDGVRVMVTESGAPAVLLQTHASGSIRVAFASPSTTAGVRVYAAPPGALPFEAVPAKEGVLFQALPLGTYEVYVDSADSGAGASVRLTTDGEVVDVTLPAPTFYAIEGRVVDENGDAIVDAWVRASSVGHAHPPAPAVLTDDDGRFSIEGLTRGSYALMAQSVAGEASADAVATGVDDVVLRLERYGSFSVRLFDAEGSAVDSFRLAYEGHGGVRRETAVMNGRTTVPSVPPGAYELMLSSARGQASRGITVRPGEDTQVDIRLATMAE